MPDPFKDLEQDITHLLTAAAKNAGANGADANGDAKAPRGKRGAQPGNRNARKHGFYARQRTLEQHDALAESGPQPHLQRHVDPRSHGPNRAPRPARRLTQGSCFSPVSFFRFVAGSCHSSFSSTGENN